MMFTPIYKLMLLIFQIKKCKQQLLNIKNIDAVKKMMCHNKMLLKTNSIMIRVDEILSTAAKIAPDDRKRNEKEEALRRKDFMKSLTSSIINIMMKNLIRKMKALALQIIII